MATGGEDGFLYRIEAVAGWFSAATKKSPERCYLLTGSDQVAVEEVKDRLIARDRESSDEPLERISFDAAVEAPAAFYDALRELPLFAARRAVVVRHAERLTQENHFPDLAELLAALADGMLCLLLSDLSAAEWRRKNHPLVETLMTRHAAACFYAPGDDREGSAWVQAYARRHQVKIAAGEAARLVSLVGLDPSELAQEMKRIVFAEGPAISDEAISLHLAAHREWSGFEWADAVIAGDRQAVKRAALASNYGKAVPELIGAFQYRLDLLEGARKAFQRRDRDFVERYGGAWPAARRATARKLLLALNLEAVSGNADAHLARLELLTWKLIAER